MIWRLAISLFLITALFGASKPVAAQDNLDDGCDWRVEPVVAATTPLDYAGACRAYQACNSDPDFVYSKCRLAALQALLASCASADNPCHGTAFLYTDTITLLRNAPPFVPQPLLDAITAFQDGNYARSLDLYEQMETNDPSLVFVLHFSKGVVYQALGQNDQALKAYADSLETLSYDPLPHYARALLYGSIGYATLASFEASWLNDYIQKQPNWQKLIAPLVERYPLDTRQFTNWTYYPVTSVTEGSGINGYMAEDESLQEPYSVQIAFDTADQALFLRNFSNQQSCLDDCSDSVLLTLSDSESVYRGSHEFYRQIHLDASSGGFYGSAE